MPRISTSIAIESAEILQGYLPPRALRMVKQWAFMHRKELLVWPNGADIAPETLRLIES